MRTLVTEAAVAARATAGPRPLVVVPRARRRGRWADLDADAVVAAIADAGAGAVVLARPAADDPGAAALPALAAVMGAARVRLPGDAGLAGWVLSVARHPHFNDTLLLRRLEVLAGAAGAPSGLPRRTSDDGASVPSVRPRVLARWAGCVWRPCPRCGGGGLAAAPCARCGAPRPEPA